MEPHPNVIHFHEMFNGPETAYLVFDLVEGGDLFDKVTCGACDNPPTAAHAYVPLLYLRATKKMNGKRAGCFKESAARDVMKSLMGILDHLEEHGVVHRDLKLSALMLRSAKSDSDIVLMDFGLAKQLPGSREAGFGRAFTECGTPSYVAPEVTSGEGYGCAADMFSAGVVAYTLLAVGLAVGPWGSLAPARAHFPNTSSFRYQGYKPFQGDDIDVIGQIRAGAYAFEEEWWNHIGLGARQAVALMLKSSPKDRPRARELLKSHDWFMPGYKFPNVSMQHLIDLPLRPGLVGDNDDDGTDTVELSASQVPSTPKVTMTADKRNNPIKSGNSVNSTPSRSSSSSSSSSAKTAKKSARSANMSPASRRPSMSGNKDP